MTNHRPRWAAAWSCRTCNAQFFGDERCQVHNLSPERRDAAIRARQCASCNAPLRERWDRYVGTCRRCVPIKLVKKLPLGLATPLDAPPVRRSFALELREVDCVRAPRVA